MKCFSDLNGTAVPVHIHLEEDPHFKKKSVRTIDLKFLIHGTMSPFFAHINCYSGGFRLCMQDPTDTVAAQIEFERKINELNWILALLAEKSFIKSVIMECDAVLKKIDSYVRYDNGLLRPAYEVKSIFSQALVEYLKGKGVDARCNIGRGTLYVGEDVIINSGITSNSSISGGIIDFLGFKFTTESYLRYMDEHYKAPRGFYEPGSWTNKLGDKPFSLALSILILEALESFITRISSLTGLSLDNTEFIALSVSSLLCQKNETQEELISLLELTEFDTKTILENTIVQRDELYQELIALDLGDTAKRKFANQDAPKILLNHFAKTIGATKATVRHPHDVEDYNQKNGYVDEYGCSHVALPDAKTRRGMLNFKNALSDPNSLASYLFDSNRMRINVAATENWDQQREICTEKWEMVDVCLGAKFPLVKRGEIVRFWFKL